MIQKISSKDDAKTMEQLEHSSDSDSNDGSSSDISKNSADISSSVGDDNFYEGTEKLLEVWFARSDNRSDHCDLRKIKQSAWETLLNFAQCKILSIKRSEHFDGYVLSESSMFVYRDRIILKTCGQTTLLNAIEPLLYLAKEFAGYDEVLDVFYSRKNFMRPELQDKMHSNFEREIELLNSKFAVGSAYCFGKINRECWYLYTLHPEIGIRVPDQTLELIMVDLDDKVMSIFTQACSSSAREASQKSGIDKLFPGQQLQMDDFLFDPCGYSMNGYLKSGHYVTIHITPEAEFSYVSFETNAPQTSYMDLIHKVLRLFGPNKFMMTIFANEESPASQQLHEYKSVAINGYYCEETQFSRFKNYELTFGNYCREAG